MCSGDCRPTPVAAKVLLEVLSATVGDQPAQLQWCETCIVEASGAVLYAIPREVSPLPGLISGLSFQAFDGALRGLGVGESIELQISGGDWKKELLFVVPRDHLEVERLEGRYKNHGGLAEGLTVELANRSMATVVEVTPEHVKLDTNNMMAGKTLLFELEVLKIESNSA
eukprot:GHUV01023153.1.p1 GENE.GHUV01023153.1~~GHUV01023153.1.p1  ORF type:complete len:170 (+),score=33.13 GHUV01023153.1:110-619(+)